MLKTKNGSNQTKSGLFDLLFASSYSGSQGKCKNRRKKKKKKRKRSKAKKAGLEPRPPLLLQIHMLLSIYVFPITIRRLSSPPKWLIPRETPFLMCFCFHHSRRLVEGLVLEDVARVSRRAARIDFIFQIS